MIEVPRNASERSETLGSKRKFWYDDAELGRCLFKYNRTATGEDWAEKIAGQIALRLGIPCARYELASHQGERGVVSPRFHGVEQSLLIGNEVLANSVSEYREATSRGSNPHHTVENVMLALQKVKPPNGGVLPGTARNGADVFIGYLMLDALIGNTDRHHENWACLDTGDICLAPTYDHASCLGRELRDERRNQLLTSHDRSLTVETYAAKATSCLYRAVGDKKTVTTLEAFVLASEYNRSVATEWQDRLTQIEPVVVKGMLTDVAEECISPSGIAVVERVIAYNKARLSSTG